MAPRDGRHALRDEKQLAAVVPLFRFRVPLGREREGEREVIYAGCSGYSFKEWVGGFYPVRTKARDFLSFYAQELSTVEVNHTFRRFPRAQLMASWAEVAPRSFRFSFKMHQSITHRARLRNVSRAVRDFVEALSPLGPRVGVVLFQLPPVFKCDIERLETFLKDLPEVGEVRFAMEFRHDSWKSPEVLDRLRARQVAWCLSELEIDGIASPPLTAPFGYLRLRKPPPYTEQEVVDLRDLLHGLAEELEDVFLYVKHDPEGRAPLDAKRLARLEG